MTRALLHFLKTYGCMTNSSVVPLSYDYTPGVGDYGLLITKETATKLCEHDAQVWPSCCVSSSSRQLGRLGNVNEQGGQKLFPNIWWRAPGKSGVETTRVPPKHMFVESPNQLNRCAGCYVLQANACANGQPLWKHKRRALWLFSAPRGRWAIAGADVRAEGFVRSSGWAYQEGLHQGLMPDQTNSRWRIFDGEGAFVSDEAFKITTQNPDSSCKGIPKSRKQLESCLPMSGALQSL